MDEKTLKKIIRETLGFEDEKLLEEALVIEPKTFELPTELLTTKNKSAHKELYENYVKTFNRVSAKLDTVSKDEANLNHSEYRALKIDETYNSNSAYLHELFFNNISDVRSNIAPNSLSYLRLERDWGTFDDWQTDFIASGLSARNGWVICGYHLLLQRYINVVVDLHSVNVPIAFYPIIVVDCWEHSYYKDYLKDRKSYIYAMMKELNWDVIEKRVNVAEKLQKAMR